MAESTQDVGLQLRSLVKDSGELQVSLVRTPIPTPDDDEILVRIEATPINPSDLGLLLGPADLSTATVTGSGTETVVTAKLSAPAMRALAARVGQSLPVGNEGAGVVVAAGAASQAQRLVGKTVAILGGAMYAQYRVVKAADALALHADATPINPSDIGLLFGAADMRNAKFSGTGSNAKVVAPIPEAYRRAMAARVGQSLPVGNEGAGEVVKAGANAQNLLGKTVAILGGAM